VTSRASPPSRDAYLEGVDLLLGANTGAIEAFACAIGHDPGFALAGPDTALVEAKIVPHFDFRRITQIAVGRGWRNATAEQQAKQQLQPAVNVGLGTDGGWWCGRLRIWQKTRCCLLRLHVLKFFPHGARFCTQRHGSTQFVDFLIEQMQRRFHFQETFVKLVYGREWITGSGRE